MIWSLQQKGPFDSKSLIKSRGDVLLTGAKDRTCHGEIVAACSHWSRCSKSGHCLTSGKYFSWCDIWKIREKSKKVWLPGSQVEADKYPDCTWQWWRRMFQLMRACKSLDTCIAETITITIAKSEREHWISLQSENDFLQLWLFVSVWATQDCSHS